MTVCMICAIMSNPDELNLKAPVAMLASRCIFHLAERYRLVTLLRLQWVNAVRARWTPWLASPGWLRPGAHAHLQPPGAGVVQAAS